jgi:prepilin-type processing-associated H-X9-DG protein
VVDVTDGASYTVLFGERSHREPLWRFMGYAHPAQQRFAVFSRWYTGGVYTGRQPHEVINYRLPSWVEADPPRMGTPAWNDLFYKRVGSYGSEHPGGSNLAMTDGSVRFVAQSIDAATLQALATKAGREVVLAD